VDVEGHGSIRLTSSSAGVLRGETPVELRRERRRTTTRTKKSPKPKDAALGVHRVSPLFDALRDLRKSLAGEAGVPPYVIFHDSTLLQMVEMHPTTRDAFAELSGVGEAKLARYADKFLALLNEHTPQAKQRGHSSFSASTSRDAEPIEGPG
jgi:ATP-dependent DNA helicase RecQ